jgi:transmembrane sensor
VSVYDQQSTNAIETSAPDKLGGIIVTPNQQLVYKRSGQKFQRVLLENPAIIRTNVSKENGVYEEAALEKVFSDLGKAYGINIVFDEEAVSGCTVTADLNNESFYEKLDLVCRAVGAQYKLLDGEVIIDSYGCK